MTRLDGPDISHYQYYQNGIGDPDWTTCRNAGCWWGATKLTQSTGYLDPTAARSRWGMRQAGFTHVGLYHWLSSTTDPIAQAEWYLKNLGDLRDGEFAMLDDEEAGVTVSMTLAWLEHVEDRIGRVSVPYTGAYTSGGTIWQSTRIRNGKHGLRPRILAAYTSEARAKGLPGVAAYPWQAWQFSSNGPVPGITGRCDMNRIDDLAAFDLAAAVGVHATPPPPIVEMTPTPMASTPDEDDDEMSGKYVAVSPNLGSALVTPTTRIDGSPGYLMIGFNDATGQRAEAHQALPHKSYSDADYQVLAAADDRHV